MLGICFATTRFNTWLHKKPGCLARPMRDVCFGSSVQLCSASFHCRRLYSQSNRTPWDTSFPLVILSLHNQRGDGMCSGLILGSVWTTAHTEHTPSHTQTIFPTLDPPFPPPLSSRPTIFIWRKLFQTDPRPGAILSPAWFCVNPVCNEAVWRQITQNTSWSHGGADEDFQQDGSWRWFAFMSACCEKWPS